jgi:hypothetical protein
MNNSTHKTAITSDGKSIIINEDGTWKYAEESKDNQSLFPFRKISWGMTKEQVKGTEEIQVIEDSPDILTYQTIILEFQTLLVYIFIQDHLVRSKYVISENHSSDNTYLLDFGKLKDMLIKKYGRPKEDRKVWQDELFKDKPDEWGSAVGRGDLALYSLWTLGDTDIFLGLSGDNYVLKLVIEYSSKSLAYLEENMRKQQALDNL